MRSKQSAALFLLPSLVAACAGIAQAPSAPGCGPVASEGPPRDAVELIDARAFEDALRDAPIPPHAAEDTILFGIAYDSSAVRSSIRFAAFVSLDGTEESLRGTLQSATPERAEARSSYWGAIVHDPRPRVIRRIPASACAPRITNRRAVERALGSLSDSFDRTERAILIWMHVDADGNVTERRIERGSGRPRLDLRALELADVAAFDPARVDGRPVSAWVQFPVVLDGRRSVPDG